MVANEKYLLRINNCGDEDMFGVADIEFDFERYGRTKDAFTSDIYEAVYGAVVDAFMSVDDNGHVYDPILDHCLNRQEAINHLWFINDVVESAMHALEWAICHPDERAYNYYDGSGTCIELTRASAGED